MSYWNYLKLSHHDQHQLSFFAYIVNALLVFFFARMLVSFQDFIGLSSFFTALCTTEHIKQSPLWHSLYLFLFGVVKSSQSWI